MTDPVTVALIGACGVVAGAVIGAFSGWWTSWLTSRQAAKSARDQQRREAYSAFLTAAMGFDLIITASETTTGLSRDSTIGEAVARAVVAIDRAYTLVILAGSDMGRKAAAEVQRKAWEIDHWFRNTGPLTPVVIDALTQHLDEYKSASAVIAGIALKELAP